MISIRREFENENGNTISIVVVHDQKGVTVSAYSKDSEVQHTWTPMEAKTLRELLTLLEPAYKNPA